MRRQIASLVPVAALVVVVAALSPAHGAPPGSYSAVADATALQIAVLPPGGGAPALSVDAGVTHGELDSTPRAAGSGAGVVQLEQSVAETEAPPDDAETAEVLAQTLGDPNLATLTLEVARGTSASETTGDATTTNLGELLGASLTLSPGGTEVLGTPPFAARSTSDALVEGQRVIARAHSDEVVLPLQLADQVVAPLCETLSGVNADLGEACQAAVDETAPLTTVATIRILPATVECVYDGTTGQASVPTAQAALLEIQPFDQEPIVVSAGQTIDLLEGTPLHIHAVVSDVATNVQGGEATASANGILLELFEGELPQVRIAASEVSCGVSGAPAAPPPQDQPPTPVTGGGMSALLALGAVALLVLGLGGRRLAKRA